MQRSRKSLLEFALILLGGIPFFSTALSLAIPPPKKIVALTQNDLSLRNTGTTAVLLNTNARSVRKEYSLIAASIVGDANVFCTSDEEQARQAAAQLVNYNVVVPLGGDGTLSTLINYMVDELLNSKKAISLEQAMQLLPKIGYIPLGTGNGVGSVVGCHVQNKWFIPGAKRRTRKQLEAVLEALKQVGDQMEKDHELVDIPMIHVTHGKHADQPKGDLCFFAGVGFDSLMLNDFNAIKTWSARTGILKNVLGSVTGYCVALVVKTLPQCALYGKHNIEVKLTTNASSDTLFVDHRRGDFVQPCNDTLLYSGTTGILAAGTSPFYGGGLRLFPFARMTRDKMHLRLGRIHPLTGFINIPSIFAGSYRDKSDRFGCLDFIGSDFSVQVREEFPFQHSGESVGHVERFRLSVVHPPVKFISFWKKRIVVDQE